MNTCVKWSQRFTSVPFCLGECGTEAVIAVTWNLRVFTGWSSGRRCPLWRSASCSPLWNKLDVCPSLWLLWQVCAHRKADEGALDPSLLWACGYLTPVLPLIGPGGGHPSFLVPHRHTFTGSGRQWNEKLPTPKSSAMCSTHSFIWTVLLAPAGYCLPHMMDKCAEAEACETCKCGAGIGV